MPGQPAVMPGSRIGRDRGGSPMIEAGVVGRVGVDFTPATPRTSLAAADG